MDVSDPESEVDTLRELLASFDFSDTDIAKLGNDKAKMQAAVARAQALVTGAVTDSSDTKFILVIGECGDGKTTLVNALRDPSEPPGKTGEDSGGVTKQIVRYKGLAINGQAIEILDTPGIGDRTVKPPELVTMIQDTLTGRDGKIDGVVVTSSLTRARVSLGAQVVQELVKKGFVSDEGGDKWKNIILCGTQMDEASQRKIKNFELDKSVMGSEGPQGIVASFFATAPDGWGPYAMVDHNDYSALKEAISKLPSVPIQYKKLDASQVADILCNVIGIDPEETKKEIARIEAEIEARYEERYQAMQEEMDKRYENAEAEHKKQMDKFKKENEAQQLAIQAEQEELKKQAEAQQKKYDQETEAIKKNAAQEMAAFKATQEAAMAAASKKSEEEQKKLRDDLARQKTEMMRDIQKKQEDAEREMNRIQRKQQELEDLKRQVKLTRLDWEPENRPGPSRRRHNGRRCKDGSLDMRCAENFGMNKYGD